MTSLRLVAVVAGKEFRERIRDRWIVVVAAVFAVLALAIAYFGAAQRGTVGFGGIEVTIASLVSLAIYLVPLIVLLLGYDCVAGERERGSLDLLLSMPITRAELLIGKYSGLAAAFAASTLAGFGLAGLALAWQADARALAHYASFVGSALLMGMAFLSLAVLASVLAADRVRASGAAIAIWFFFVLIFDLLMVALLVAGGDRAGGEALPYLLFLNPADVFRVMNVFGMEELRTLYGLATVAPPAMLKPPVLVGVLVAWIAAPLALAAWRFR
jgi:Cu-processing system permease protein